MSILTATRWNSNAEMIEDVAKLGYLDGYVLDVTYGYGTFWKNWQPDTLLACDIDPEKSPTGASTDFTNLPYQDNLFDSVVLDPPYKLNGTPTGSAHENGDPDHRYGTQEPMRWQDRYAIAIAGIGECARVTKKYLLVKCMDQVCSGQKRWQTIDFANAGAEHGLLLVDRFDLLITPRPQPPGRRQVHTQINYSTLLVMEKP